MMKIAVTYEDGQVFSISAIAGNSKIYETEKDTVILSGLQYRRRADWGTPRIFEGAWVDTLICGGIGAGTGQAP